MPQTLCFSHDYIGRRCLFALSLAQPFYPSNQSEAPAIYRRRWWRERKKRRDYRKGAGRSMVAAVAVGTGRLSSVGWIERRGKGGFSHIQQSKAAQPFRQGKYI